MALQEKATLARKTKKALDKKDAKIADLKKKLKKNRTDATITNQKKYDTVESSKKIVEELKNKEENNLKLAVEKKTAKETVQAWRPIFDKAVEKMNANFPIYGGLYGNLLQIP